MMKRFITREELRWISEAVGERQGWDFSSMQTEKDPVPWDYIDTVKRYLNSDDIVLDVGTGGGEKFLRLAPCLGKGLGIDINLNQITVARSNIPEGYVDRISFEVGDGANLPVKDKAFQVVLNRHAGDVYQMEQYASEVVRVLRPGGLFITQEVGYRNVENIATLFNSPPYMPELSAPKMAKIYQSLNCRVICIAEYDVRWFICDVESFIFWAKVFFQNLEERLDVINQILTDYMTPRGIETNEHRELLIVQKR